MGLIDRLSHAWNAFFGKGPPYNLKNEFMIPKYIDLGYSSFNRPDRVIFTRGQEKTFVNTMINRISIDCASINIRHVKIDDNGRYLEEIKSDLNDRLTTEANKDQTGRAFVQDVVASMLDEGCVAIVPVDTEDNPKDTNVIKILSWRAGKITQWYPNDVQIELYNDITGQRQTITMPKKSVAIVENPFYAIMNEPNSILQRLVKKLNLLDVVDAESGSGKLNLILQLPYVIKTEARKKQAAERRADIEDQLAKSKYGIAYTDGTEKVTQLNRPAESNLLTQIQYLTSMLFSQLGLTESILNGTADEKTMLNYQNRIVVPIMSAVTEEMRRKFLTKTARSQGQSIMFFAEAFKFVQISDIAEIGDKMTRNEIMTPNEIRQIVGLKPSKDPKADELRNRNINQSTEEINVEEQQEKAIKIAKKTE